MVTANYLVTGQSLVLFVTLVGQNDCRFSCAITSSFFFLQYTVLENVAISVGVYVKCLQFVHVRFVKCPRTLVSIMC